MVWLDSVPFRDKIIEPRPYYVSAQFPLETLPISPFQCQRSEELQNVQQPEGILPLSLFFTRIRAETNGIMPTTTTARAADDEQRAPPPRTPQAPRERLLRKRHRRVSG